MHVYYLMPQGRLDYAAHTVIGGGTEVTNTTHTCMYVYYLMPQGGWTGGTPRLHYAARTIIGGGTDTTHTCMYTI